MRVSENIKNRVNMISQMKNESTFQILEYDSLEGAKDIQTSIKISLMKNSNIRLRQVRLILDNSAVKIEAGALSYMKGDLEIEAKTGGIIGIGKKFFQSKVTGESTIKPIIRGTGEVFLESTFSHFTLIELEDEEIIVDDGLFYACEEDIEVEVAMQKNVSSIMFGNEGVYQTRLKGSGIVVLQIPVPEKEIFRCKLFNFAILRTGNIEFSVEKSGSSLIKSALNGEGLLNVYRGTGEVWLAPTLYKYNELEENDIDLSDED